MRKQDIPRSPATEQELEIVRQASANPSVLVGRENDTIAFFKRVGKHLEVSNAHRDWLEKLGKKMGMIETTDQERKQFAEEAESVAKHGGRLSNRYWAGVHGRRGRGGK